MVKTSGQKKTAYAFEHATKALRLDLSKSNLRGWADRFAVYLKGSVATKDIMRRLFNMQKDRLEREGVRIELEDERPDVDDIAADADSEEQRHTLVQAAALFSEKKHEGPTCRCGCCGQLNFKSTMTRYTNKSHAAQGSEVQGKLAYMTVFPRQSDGRLCCSSCIGSLV